MVVQEANLKRALIKERGREALHALPNDSTRDGSRVDLVRLARLALATPCLTHHPWRDPNNTLTSRDQRLLKTPGEMPAVLDRPHALPIELARPAKSGAMPALISTNLKLTGDHAAITRNRRQCMSALVDIRSNHDHYQPSLHWIAVEVDLQRTDLSRGGATLLSSHAGDPRAAASDKTHVGQSTDRQTAYESARRQPENQPARSDNTARQPRR